MAQWLTHIGPGGRRAIWLMRVQENTSLKDTSDTSPGTPPGLR
jgi:hypothetical protein